MQHDEQGEAAVSRGGCVCAGDTRTADAGASLLARGGNAVDAAVRSVMAAFAAEPILASAFGGGSAHVFDVDGTAAAWDFFSEVPALRLAPPATAPPPDFSSSDLRLHFGLGNSSSPATLNVTWPDGASETFTGLAPGSAHRLQRSVGSFPHRARH